MTMVTKTFDDRDYVLVPRQGTNSMLERLVGAYGQMDTPYHYRSVQQRLTACLKEVPEGLPGVITHLPYITDRVSFDNFDAMKIMREALKRGES